MGSGDKMNALSSRDVNGLERVLDGIVFKGRNFASIMGNAKEEIGQAVANGQALGTAQERVSAAALTTEQRIKNVVDYLKAGLNATMNLGNVLLSTAQAGMAISMALNGITNVMQTLNDETSSFGQKLMAISSTMIYIHQAVKAIRESQVFLF